MPRFCQYFLSPMCAILACVACADARAASQPPVNEARNQKPVDVHISRVMVDPTVVSDEMGEWIELANHSASPVDLRGWRLASARDPGYTIPASLLIQPHAAVFLGRSGEVAANGGVHVAHVYSGIALANSADWLVLANPSGVTVDSVGWDRAPRGEPIEHAASDIGGSRGLGAAPAEPAPAARVPVSAAQPTPAPRPTSPQPPSTSELIVRILDVGQGDAILIQNGGSTVLVDGGPAPAALGQHLD